DLMAPDVGGLPLSGCRQAVIAAAITKVDACEADPEGTRRVNVLGTLALVRQLWDRDILPVFLSSDYVFPGTDPSGYGDSAQPCAATEYGRQKAEVEAALGTSGRPHLVLRLSKVFGLQKGDGTLLDDMAAALAARRHIAAAFDQVFCPAWVRDVV